MEGRLNERIDAMGTRIDTTNENMQAQLAQHRIDISSDVRRLFEERGLGQRITGRGGRPSRR